MRIAVFALAAALGIAPAAGAAPAKSATKSTTAKPAATKSSDETMLEMLQEQKLLIEQQRKLIAEQDQKLSQQGDSLGAQRGRLEAMQLQLDSMNRRLLELQDELPDSTGSRAIEERLRRIEQATQKIPELPPDVVSAGDFPGSIRIPGSDAAIKFGGRIRTAVIFTLDPLGSTDRFLTNSIPVAGGDFIAGDARRSSITANTSRFNFEMRTPAGASQVRTFIEGDFYGGPGGGEDRTNFRLRHAYAQYRGFLMGQTWSTFADPTLDFEDLDFEGINGENTIRQSQLRYRWMARADLSVAVAVETPRVSITGGQGVNLVPDLVARTYKTFGNGGHTQLAVVLRKIRGESDSLAGDVQSAYAYGASVSGLYPLKHGELSDRIIFQFNTGKGNARYINDLNSLGGQDAVFDPATGNLDPLPATGWYVVYERQWTTLKNDPDKRLRSSLGWSYVDVDNRDYQPADAYNKTHRMFVNLVYSPIRRFDMGAEFIHGWRENKDGNRGTANQIQAVTIFRF